MTNQTVKILGWVYGRLEYLLVGYHRTNIVNPEERPLTSYVMIRKKSTDAKVITRSEDKAIRELMDKIELSEFEEAGDPEKVVSLEQQGIWELAYNKGKRNAPLDFAFPIAKHREAAGMTQTELANLLGVSQPAVAKWESGKTNPSVEVLEKIKGIFGV